MLPSGGRPPRGAAAADTTLVKAPARAFRWRRIMEAGRQGTLDALAGVGTIAATNVSRRLRLWGAQRFASS